MNARIKFWGVRGSIATPGPETHGTGGNTSCVETCLGSQRIILDGGTGLRALGTAWGARPLQATLLFSHLHWDHIQGVPFFGPLYHPDSKITLMGPKGLDPALHAQMSRPNFPVGMEVMGARIEFVELAPGDTFALGDVRVATLALNHPGGAIGYRLEHRGKKVVYACDHEHRPGGPEPELSKFAARADLLIYDAQYLPDEYPGRIGWGHSTYAKGAELAAATKVHRLVLTHHEPNRSDAQVAGIEENARRLFPDSWAAREGMAFTLDPDQESLPLCRMLEAYLASSMVSG